MSAEEDLAVWLTAVWDEEERLATEAQEECPSLTWEAEKVYDGVYAIALGPSEHPDSDSYDVGDDTRMPREIARHIAYHDPASVLARIAADRKILARSLKMISLGEGDDPTGCWEMISNFGWGTLEDLAESYADRPDCPAEWLVERQGVEQ